MLRLYWAQERGQFQFALFNSFVMPGTLAYLGLMLLPEDLDLLRWWMAGSVAFGLGMGGLGQVGFAVLNDRFLGRLDLLRTFPVARGAYYGAQIAVAVLQAVALVVVSLVALRLLEIAPLDLFTVAAGVAVAVCASVAIGGLAAALALRARDFDAGNTAVAVAALGLAAISPVFYALSDLPRWLQPLAVLSPFTHIAPLLRALLAGRPLPTGSLLATLALALLLNVVAYRLIRWSE
jgi:ABC-2 type transport system permease protein